MEGRAQIVDPTALPLGKTTGIFRMGGWPGRKTGQDSLYKIKPLETAGNRSMIIQLSNCSLITTLIHSN
jgi:hypothetical protein